MRSVSFFIGLEQQHSVAVSLRQSKLLKRKMPPSQGPVVREFHESKRKGCRTLNGVSAATVLSDKSMPAVQRLHDACKIAFCSGAPEPSRALELVKSILDEIKPSDVGLEQVANVPNQGNNIFRSTSPVRRAPAITYLQLFDCNEFSMGIFCLPKSASIPLHNHPGMTVLSKLLYGTMLVKSFDWVNPCPNGFHRDYKTPQEAILVEDTALSAPCETDVLFPSSGGNIHSFSALTDCAVLDVLAPPYDFSKGRHCTYFREFSQNGELLHESSEGEKEGRKTWLVAHNPPADFAVRRGNYQGPVIHD